MVLVGIEYGGPSPKQELINVTFTEFYLHNYNV